MSQIYKRIEFIDMPEMELITLSPMTIKMLRRISLHTDLLAQVMNMVTASNIVLRFDSIRLIFCDTKSPLLTSDVQQGPFGTCIYIFNTNLKEFINEQLRSDPDTLFIPKLI